MNNPKLQDKKNSRFVMHESERKPLRLAAIALLAQFAMLVQLKSAESSDIALPGCQDNCNGVPIPYPLGIGDRCSLSREFNVTCDTIYTGTLTPYLYRDLFQIVDISIASGQARFKMPIFHQCYNVTSGEEVIDQIRGIDFSESPWWLNNKKNEFVVIGCHTLADLTLNDTTEYSVGCISTCDNVDSLNRYGPSCSGVGCCHTAFPKAAKTFMVNFDANYDHSQIYNFSNCSYAMIVETDGFQFDTDYATSDSLKYHKVPVIFDYVTGNTTCKVAQDNQSTYTCKSNHSVCSDYTDGTGYRCNCSHGYQGNPYLQGVNGCQDIDECATRNPCPGQAKCHNLPGTYRCSPPECHFGRRNNSNNVCELNLSVIIGMTVVAGFITSILVLLIYIAIAKHIKLFERRKQEKLKQEFFVQNRGLLLQQLINSHEDATQKMRIFRLDELEKATNKFDETLILGKGGHGEVYKGILSDQRVVAIKRSKIIDRDEIDQFINEVVILSQLSHRNVVKLYGCCLETEVPLLVYEFISNGTLYNQLHVVQPCSLTWKQRLKIAVEAAGAISYLHSSASISIFHRDIKSANILLDDYFTAKVSDFGASRSVQVDQTGITTAIQGTHGYLDPEYYYTGRLTQKSDVYSFGVILAELLTREKPLFSSSIFEGGSLTAYFSSAMKENRLFDILDPEVVYEENRAELEEVAKLAEVCLRMKGDERPSMKEVEVHLGVLLRSNEQQKHPWNRKSQSMEEKELILFDYNKGIDVTESHSFEQEQPSSSYLRR